MAIVTALTAEVSALRDRLDTHEALAEKRRFATIATVEKYRVSVARREFREAARQDMLARVFRILLEDLDAARLAQDAAAHVLAAEADAT